MLRPERTRFGREVPENDQQRWQPTLPRRQTFPARPFYRQPTARQSHRILKPDRKPVRFTQNAHRRPCTTPAPLPMPPTRSINHRDQLPAHVAPLAPLPMYHQPTAPALPMYRSRAAHLPTAARVSFQPPFAPLPVIHRRTAGDPDGRQPG